MPFSSSGNKNPKYLTWHLRSFMVWLPSFFPSCDSVLIFLSSDDHVHSQKYLLGRGPITVPGTFLVFWCFCIISRSGCSILEFSYLTWPVRQTPMHSPRPNTSITFSIKPWPAPLHLALNTRSFVPPLQLVLTSGMEIIDGILLVLPICIRVFPGSLWAAWVLDFIHLCNPGI